MADFSSFLSPGVRVQERTEGFRTGTLVPHTNLYLFASSSLDTDSVVKVSSLADFTNVFGASPSTAHVRQVFRNDSTADLYVVKVSTHDQATIEVDVLEEDTYSLTVNSVTVEYEGQPGDTEEDILTALATLIDSQVPGVTTRLVGSVLKVRHNIPSALTVTGTANLDVAVTTPVNPTPLDYIAAIEGMIAVADSYQPGFLFAPECLGQSLPTQERIAVVQALLATAATLDWFALIDCAPESTTPNLLQLERANYSTSLGHGALYAPYLVNLEGATIPPSSTVAGATTAILKRFGFPEPFAGTKYDLRGITGVAQAYGIPEQNQLNPLGVNLIRPIRNRGILIWAMRTLSADALYRFTSTRIVMNVLNNSLRRAFDEEVFRIVDGKGAYLLRVGEVARAVCRQIYLAGGFFGADETEAFYVRCSFVNNPPEQLEQGNILVEVYAIPTPVSEKVLVLTYRTAIGQLPTE